MYSSNNAKNNETNNEKSHEDTLTKISLSRKLITYYEDDDLYNNSINDDLEYLKRMRPVTQESIREILGLKSSGSSTWIYSSVTAYSSENLKKNHCHPFPDKPINCMSFSDLLLIFKNYDIDRDTSEIYAQNDEIEFLLDELSFQGICIILRNSFGEQPASDTLLELTNSILNSKYLSNHHGMKLLAKLSFNINKTFLEETCQKESSVLQLK